MATIKISELQPKSQLEKVSDADLQAVNGGTTTPPSFQLILGGTSATTGAAVGGRVENGTNTVFTLNLEPSILPFSASVNARAFAFSSPI
jgi:hypothetical protein